MRRYIDGGDPASGFTPVEIIPLDRSSRCRIKQENCIRLPQSHPLDQPVLIT
jgi:hypothetical protein